MSEHLHPTEHLLIWYAWDLALRRMENVTICFAFRYSLNYKNAWWYFVIVITMEATVRLKWTSFNDATHPLRNITFLFQAMPMLACLYTIVLEHNMMTSSNGSIFRVTSLCAGNSPVIGEFPSQRPAMRCFDVFFDLCLNKRLSKHSRRCGDLRRHCAHYGVTVMSRPMCVSPVDTNMTITMLAKGGF